MKNLAIAVEGMSCGHCLNAVNQAIAKAPGARAVSVRIGRAEVEYDESQTSPSAIAEFIRAAGYPASPIQQ